MFGGDIYHRDHYLTFFEAFSKMKEMIEYDGSRCGTIRQHPIGQYTVYLKDAKKTDPSKSSYHNKCSSFFYARKI